MRRCVVASKTGISQVGYPDSARVEQVNMNLEILWTKAGYSKIYQDQINLKVGPTGQL